MKVLSIKASYSIFETWTAKRSRILLFEAKGQRSANLWLPGRTSVLKENLNISPSQILPSLYKDAGWCKGDVKNVKKQKGHLSRSIGMLSQRSYVFVIFVFCVRNSVSSRRFVINVCWFSAGLEYFLSSTTIIWLLLYPKVAIIVQVVQTIQTDVSTFRLTKRGSNLANPL